MQWMFVPQNLLGWTHVFLVDVQMMIDGAHGYSPDLMYGQDAFNSCQHSFLYINSSRVRLCLPFGDTLHFSSKNAIL